MLTARDRVQHRRRSGPHARKRTSLSRHCGACRRTTRAVPLAMPSCEPCAAMCIGRMYWGGIRSMVYALPAEEGLAKLAGGSSLVLFRELLARAKNGVLVIGPGAGGASSEPSTTRLWVLGARGWRGEQGRRGGRGGRGGESEVMRMAMVASVALMLVARGGRVGAEVAPAGRQPALSLEVGQGRSARLGQSHEARDGAARRRG